MNIKPLYFALLTSAFFTTSVSACEFHDAPMFGVMGMSHPMMNRHAKVDFGELVVSHDNEVTTNANESANLVIRYKLPLNYRDVSLDFSASNGIQLKHKGPVKIDRMMGSYSLAYTATTGGSQLINVRVEAMKNGKPYSHVQHVNLTVL